MACEPYQVSNGDRVRIDEPRYGIAPVVDVVGVSEHGIYGRFEHDGKICTRFFNFDEISVIHGDTDKTRIAALEKQVAALKEIVGLLVEGSPETAKEKFWGLLS